MTVLRPVDPVYSSCIPKPLLITSLKNKRIAFHQTFPSRDYPKTFYRCQTTRLVQPL